MKWWAVEVLVLLSGLLANPKLETSVLSICLTISTLHFTLSYGIGAAASTRVSNELGAGNPGSARFVVRVVMFLAVTKPVTISILLFCFRRVLGRAFSSEKQVINYISIMTPLICVSTVTDSLQAAISEYSFKYSNFTLSKGVMISPPPSAMVISVSYTTLAMKAPKAKKQQSRKAIRVGFYRGVLPFVVEETRSKQKGRRSFAFPLYSTLCMNGKIPIPSPDLKEEGFSETSRD
ncbi:hypothetical protein MIMGU_mgv11b016522mg [Erythranthe guttata]|uniref:Uncharacterized protein n=1 Tax=Erythranthe guttata TaxID=4155 RepID=A0A022RQU9_ERYGU|nr:hypothetical protein MIMGU_mgv11b016522mg [Erythranthe guttata]